MIQLGGFDHPPALLHDEPVAGFRRGHDVDGEAGVGGGIGNRRAGVAEEGGAEHSTKLFDTLQYDVSLFRLPARGTTIQKQVAPINMHAPAIQAADLPATVSKMTTATPASAAASSSRPAMA